MALSACGVKGDSMHKLSLWHTIIVNVKDKLPFIFLLIFWGWALYGWADPTKSSGTAKIIISILSCASILLIAWCIITTIVRMGVFTYQDYIYLVLYNVITLFITFDIASRFVANIEPVINDIIDGFIEEPAVFHAGLFALLIARWIYMSFVRVPNQGTSESEYGFPSVLSKPSKASLKLTSIHECGHALVYTLLKTKPSMLRMSLTREFMNGVASLGYMESNIELDGRASRDQLYWRMLVSLGGTAAELAVYGKEFEGALQDMRSWQAAAERYLLNGLGDVLVEDDGRDTSVRHNINAFNRLYAEQKEIVQCLMRDNVTILQEMAAELRRDGTLETERICWYLERVVVADQIPVFE